MANHGRTVPWRDWDEWEAVRDGLFGDHGGDDSGADDDEAHVAPSEISALEGALARVEAWSARGRLPVAVAASGDLSGALAVEKRAEKRTRRRDELHAARQSLGLALVRTVGALADARQDTAYARSMASVASDMNLPVALVDVRHAATHGVLPPAPVLRSAAQRALNWVRSNYWDKQQDLLSATRATADRAAHAYRAAVFAPHRNQTQGSKKGRSKGKKKHYRDVVKGKGALEKLIELAASPNTTTRDLLPALRDNILAGDAIAASHIRALWKPLVAAIHERWAHFTPALATYALDLARQASETGTPPAQVAKVARLLYVIGRHFRRTGADIDLAPLARGALSIPNPTLCAAVATAVLSHPHHSVGVSPRLLALLGACVDPEADAGGRQAPPAMTLEAISAVAEALAPSGQEQRAGAWSMVRTWHPLAFGVTVGPVTDLDLVPFARKRPASLALDGGTADGEAGQGIAGDNDEGEPPAKRQRTGSARRRRLSAAGQAQTGAIRILTNRR